MFLFLYFIITFNLIYEIYFFHSVLLLSTKTKTVKESWNKMI